LDYSNHKHDFKASRLIKKNITGISKLSKERLLDELKKYVKSNILIKLSKDKFSVELFEIIFPQIKKIKLFSNPNEFAKTMIQEADFVFLISLLIIDGSDNTDYFIYKFNISKKNQKRLKIIDKFYNEKFTATSFSEKNLNKFFYFHGKEAVIDILSYRIFFLKKVDKKLLNFINIFKSKVLPTMPVGAKVLMEKYDIQEGEILGKKLKIIEEEWVNNNFQLSEKQISKIIKH
jgi:poly(A) polymerase